MKAAFAPKYGQADVVEIRDLPRPVPQTGEVLVEVHATTVTRTDRETLRAHPWFARPMTGLMRPKQPVLGVDFAGRVAEVGAGVTGFSPGDRVFGLSPVRNGCHAEFVAVAADGAIARLPDTIPFHEAVVGEGVWYAHSNLEAFGLGPGQNALIYGASGAIGTAALQLAKVRDATVTAVVGPQHMALAHDLGADLVIDYTSEDFTRRPERYDLVFDAVGKTTYPACRRLLKPDGAFYASDLGPWGQTAWLALWSAIARTRRVAIGMPRDPRDVIGFLGDMLADGRYRAVIDSHYPLDDIADAYAHVATEQKTGIVVVDVKPG
ncbi:NAD(P)-dependent alcohol dehydrogenase [Maritimibacter sp. UBA3975]|uniref:NAD(P)-dependent alcohol dehydrogenase n=1 Tax=Maritimibacter sp. UBA3975 TaxID=1946833 RepID=UPI000C0A9FD5|nr:NAD(P)-dependent alcohol dehydrogenase [Maritimibacter sp. UBA3975]MAM62556.1 alcohol dehydrogenase [Maritimibacter sp.]|tara:strand:+ start:3087 stop:4052 length:966 start_codon:yes stop_codon:yes gene_type:complete